MLIDTAVLCQERVDVKSFSFDGSYYKLSTLLSTTSDRTKNQNQLFDDINNMYDDLRDDSSHHNLDKNDDHQNNKHVIIHENPFVQESHLQESTVETQQEQK
ncbi:uncharacterized protein LOC116405552 [Cucumis sativus]|uniref:uncharacterized protein LOC116403503 n=1 Tax=Cucumis sativus TaxID=3659 RepID=UPI0012F490DE|nr:uncharacterized protein LOC116403503 [Cucumis sativus]XP_031745369.1 uncharacterized protein LOC116405552 [Cucumis sativus]